MSFNRRQLRRWAARVLMAWLFGMVAGVVNACVIDTPMKAVHATHAVAHADQSQSHDGNDDGNDDGNGTCRDFCEKSAVSLLSTSTGTDAGTVLPALPAAPVSITLAALQGAARPVASDRLSGPLPVRIAFVRLAL